MPSCISDRYLAKFNAKTATVETGELHKWCELPIRDVQGVGKIRYCKDFQRGEDCVSVIVYSVAYCRILRVRTHRGG